MKKLTLLLFAIILVNGCGNDENRLRSIGGGGGAEEIEYQEGHGAISLVINKEVADDLLLKASQHNKIPSKASSISLRVWNEDGYNETIVIRLNNESASSAIIQIPVGESYYLDAIAYEYLQYITNEGKSLLTAGRSAGFNITDNQITEISLELTSFSSDFNGTDTTVKSEQEFNVNLTVSGPDVLNLSGDTAVLTAMHEPWSKDGSYASFKKKEYAIHEIVDLADQTYVVNDDGVATLSLSFTATAPEVSESVTLYYQVAIYSEGKSTLFVPSISSNEELRELSVKPTSGVILILR